MILGNGSSFGFHGGGLGGVATGYGFYQGNNSFTKSNIEDTAMHIIVANRNYILIDGVNQTSVISSATFDFIALGGTDGNFRPSFIVAEILLYDYLMSEADAIQLSNNINAKYLKY
jgi:hypothetical protein